MAHSPGASIVIPVRNGGATALETIRAVLRQQLAAGFEVIVIDSESSDGSPEAIQRIFADPTTNPSGVSLRLVRIAVRDFGHGKTRNQGARLAAGQAVVFLSQDATPVGSDWLEAMLRPLTDAAVAGVFCRQVPRSWASIPERFIMETAYPPQASTRTRSSLSRRDAGYILFSNAASVIRKTDILGTPFKDELLMCEDAHWAAEVLRAGRSIAYITDAKVSHSHGYSLSHALSRTFDYAVALEGMPGGMTIRGYAGYLRRGARFAARKGGIAGMAQLAAVELVRCGGYLLGSQYRRVPPWLCRRLSGFPAWFDKETAPASKRQNSPARADIAPPR